MEVIAPCDICGRPANLNTCIACGKRVCTNCYNSLARICKEHAKIKGAPVKRFN